MTERDAIHRELIEAEAVHAGLIARAASNAGPFTGRAFDRWIREAERNVTKLRERVAKMEATG